MSHFSVSVISKDNSHKTITGLLAPYYEGSEDRKYCTFQDTEEEHLKEYLNEEREMFKNKETGELLFPWDEEISEAVIKDELNVSGYEKVMVKHTERYSTFEEYMSDYESMERDETTGKYGYWSNPNAKWDWWQVGGRWSGQVLFTKDGKYTDSDKIKNIDFFHINKEEYAFNLRFWEVVVEDSPLKDGETENDFFNMWKKEYYLDKYGSKEKYAKELCSPVTFAFVDQDGKWYGKGDMGWFAMSSATKESTALYFEKYNEAISKADPEFYITIVDCHI